MPDPLRVSSPPDDPLVDSGEPVEAPNTALYSNPPYTEVMEESVRYAVQEAKENPDILIAIESHHDDIHKLRRQQVRKLELVEEDFEEELAACSRDADSAHKLGKRRAKEIRDGREQKVQQDFEKARMEIDKQLERKIARSRATRRYTSVHEAHETLNARLSEATYPQTEAETASPPLPIPPLQTSPSPGGSYVRIDERTMPGNVTPYSTMTTRPTLSYDGRLSPQTPALDSKLDPRILSSSPTCTPGGDSAANMLSYDDAGGMGIFGPSPPTLSTGFCMWKDCCEKPLYDLEYCAQHR